MPEIADLIEKSQKHLTTIRDYLRFMVSVFTKANLYYGHGTSDPYEEAMYLMCHATNLPLNLSADELNIYLDAKLMDSEIYTLVDMIKKRAVDKIPAPYIVNKAICQGYEFYVDERVIIPRSFIPEIIVNDGLKEYLEHPELVHNVLDLCTGNGSIAIIAHDYFYDSHVVAVDIDNDALEVAKINVENHSLNGEIELVQSDLFTNLINYKEQFDLILTNPPYVDTECMSNLTSEYHHEPKLALDGGIDGLILVDIILKEAANYLTEFGLLVLEMGDNVEELVDKYPELPFKWLDTQSGDGFVFLLTKKDLELLNA